MPTIVLNESTIAPKSLGKNNLAHATIHRRYAFEVLKYPIWGMSPSAVPEKDTYGEYGVKVLGAKGYESGAVTPHVSALALAVTPKEAIANLRTLIKDYPVYGEFGFYDSVNPLSKEVAYKYMALDQGMLFLGITNYLTDGYIQKQFTADPIIQKIIPLINKEDFFN